MRTLVTLLVLILLAGCLGGTQDGLPQETASTTGSGAAPLTTPSQAPSPAPNVDNGALSVSVVTSEMAPVPAAQVAVTPLDLVALTDGEGRATFNDLPPGEYTVNTAKPGFVARQAEGRVAAIRANEATELRLVLDPVEVVTPESAYHETLTFRGFIACGVAARPPPTGTATTFSIDQYCGRGVSVNGQNYLRDPNDNSSHSWPVKHPSVEGWWLEAMWKPSADAFTRSMLFSTSANFQCQNVTCTSSGGFGSGGGESPVRILTVEGAQKNITKVLNDPAKFPYSVLTRAQPWCPSTCVAPMLNQAYEVFLTAFYGEDPPLDFTVLPK